MSITPPQNFKKIGGDLDHPQRPPIFKGPHQRELHGKWDIGYISARRPSTFKVWEIKVSFLFCFLAQEPRYLQFLPLMIGRTLHLTFRRRYYHIFAPRPHIEKVGHFAFSNFKSWRRECVLGFFIKGLWAKIWPFLLLKPFV